MRLARRELYKVMNGSRPQTRGRRVFHTDNTWFFENRLEASILYLPLAGFFLSGKIFLKKILQLQIPMQKIIDAWVTGLVGLFGGIAYYLYTISKGSHFQSRIFMIHAFLSFFIGWLVGEFIPNDMTYKYGMVAVSGFFALEIIKLLEKKLPILFDKYIDKWLPK